MNVLVKNVPGTADLQPPYPYDTWIEYWEGKSDNRLIPILSTNVLLEIVRMFVTGLI